MTWNSTFVISFNSNGVLICENIGDIERPTDWISLFMSSGRGVLLIIPLMWGSLFVYGIDEIDDLADWKSGIVLGRESSRNKLNRNKDLPS